MFDVENVVLGAGITGLSYAAHDENTIVLEKDATPGGYCRTICRNGFVWDYAGHFFHFNDEEAKGFFKSAFKQESCVTRKKTTKILFQGKWIDYPFQCNIHQLPKEDFIDCLYDLYFKDSEETYSTFKGMLIAKFGEGISRRFLVPYNEKLYACDLDKLDKDAMGRFFPYANLDQILKNMKTERIATYNDLFVYPREGAQTIINYLVSMVSPERVKLQTELLSLDIANNIANTSSGKIHYRNLINTIPLCKFISYLPDELQPANENVLSWNKVLVFNIGFDRAAIQVEYDWIYLPEKEYVFYRVGFYSNILGADRLSIYVEIGYDKDDEINIEDAFNQTLVDLRRIGLIDNHEVVDFEPIIMDPAYVHISKEGNEYRDSLLGRLEDYSVYSLGRYGGWKYCSMEDCYVSARELAKRLRELG